MVTLEDINFAEARTNELERQYNEAKNAVYQLKLQYIAENAKFKFGDKCHWGSHIYTIIAPKIEITDHIKYICDQNGEQIIMGENLLTKIEK